MIRQIDLQEAFDTWFNHFHPSSLSADLRGKAGRLMTLAGGPRITNEGLRSSIDEIIAHSKKIYLRLDTVSDMDARRQFAEVLAMSAICFQKVEELDQARELLSAAVLIPLPIHERAVLAWMLGSVDILRGRNLQGYKNLRAGIDGFTRIRDQKQRLLNRRRDVWNQEDHQMLSARYLDWYQAQINNMNKVLAGVMQQALDWLGLDKWGHFRTVTKTWQKQLRAYLEHADPREKDVLSVTGTSTDLLGMDYQERNVASRMRLRKERGDPQKARAVIAEMLRLSHEVARVTHRDGPAGNPPRLGTPYLELPEVMVVCAWGFYEICDLDASIQLLLRALRLFSDGNWMQSVARWMLGIVYQDLPGSELLGMAEWQRAAEQMEEFAFRSRRQHENELLAHLERINDIMRLTLSEPPEIEIPDADMEIRFARINLAIQTTAVHFQDTRQREFLQSLSRVLRCDVHQLRVTRLTNGCLLVTIQLLLDKAVSLLNLYLNQHNSLLSLPDFKVPGIEPLPEERRIGEDLEHMEDEMRGLSEDKELSGLLLKRREILEKLLALQDQRAQLTNPLRATFDIQSDEKTHYKNLLQTTKDLRDTYLLNQTRSANQ